MNQADELAVPSIARRPAPEPAVIAAVQAALDMLISTAPGRRGPDPLADTRWRFSGRWWHGAVASWGRRR